MTNIQNLLQSCSETTAIILMAAFMIVGAAVVAAYWMLFKKANKRVWAALVPFYNQYTLYSVVWGNGWFFLIETALSLATIYTTGFICWVFLILDLAFCCIHQYKTAKSFGKGVGFAVGLVLLYPLFICILAFCSYEYIGPSGKPVRISCDDE